MMSSSQLFAPNTQSGSLIDLQESWSFTIEDYAIEHQGQAIIDIEVSYDYVDRIGVPDPLEYPDFVPINDFIENFLVNYPNETDFWEILNKNLVTSLLTQPIPTPYGVEYQLNEVLDSLTVRIDVEPGAAGVNIPRSSTVTGSPKPKIVDDGGMSEGLIPSDLYRSVQSYDPLFSPANGTKATLVAPLEQSAGSSASFWQGQGSRSPFDYRYSRGSAFDSPLSLSSPTQRSTAFM